MKSASKKRNQKPRSQSGDALEVLRKQHREVEDLLSRFEDASSNEEARAIAAALCEKLTVHSTIEEEIFYPAAKEQEEEAILEATEEHLSVKRIVADLEELDAEDERLRPKVNVLKDQVSQHVDEEEHDLFPKLEKEMSQEERDELGQQLQERTHELQGPPPNGTSGVPKGRRAAGGARREGAHSSGRRGH